MGVNNRGVLGAMRMLSPRVIVAVGLPLEAAVINVPGRVAVESGVHANP
jgi:hypothetical protein